MRSFASAIPLFTLGIAVVLVAAFLLAPVLARRLRARRWVAWLLVVGFGVVIAATLLPHRDAAEAMVPDLVCDTSRIGLPSLSELTRVSDTSLNVLLFVPLGIAVALLPWSRAALAITIAAFSLTFVVEAIQLLVTALGRGCQTADMVDNLIGLVIGIGMGLLARPLLRATPA